VACRLFISSGFVAQALALRDFATTVTIGLIIADDMPSIL
jgi:hypothetical protein